MASIQEDIDENSKEQVPENSNYTSSVDTQIQSHPSITINRRKRSAVEDTEIELLTNKRRPNHMISMDSTDLCDRCDQSLSSLYLKCSSCKRIFHRTCRTQDEEEPSDEPGSRWKCRVCSTPAANMSFTKFMSVLDRQQCLDDELMNCVTHLVKRLKTLEDEVAILRCSQPRRKFTEVSAPSVSQEQLTDEDMDMSPVEQTPLPSAPQKSVLVVGDSIVLRLKSPLKKLLPGNSIAIRSSKKQDIESILKEADTFACKAAGPVTIFLQAGFHECMNFERAKFLSAVRNFNAKLRVMNEQSQLFVLSVPLFGMDCKSANDELQGLVAEEGSSLNFINLSVCQQPMVMGGSYTYKGEVADKVALNLARRAAPFLGTKISKPKKKPVTQPTRVEMTLPQTPRQNVHWKTNVQSNIRSHPPHPPRPRSLNPPKPQRQSSPRQNLYNHRMSVPPPPNLEDFIKKVLEETLNKRQSRGSSRQNSRSRARGRRQSTSQGRMSSRSCSRTR